MRSTAFDLTLSTCLLLGCCVALCTTASGQEPQPREEKRLWEETGKTVRGKLDVHRERAVPLTELNRVDAATLEQLERRWERLRSGARHELPPLKYTVSVDRASGQPQSPPTPLGPPTRAPGDFVFFQLSNPSAAAPSGFSSTTNEPSVVAVDDRVFYTGNWYVASSTNGGSSFSFVNPFTGPFSPVNDGFCCDQVTAYDPGTDSLFFIQQYIDDGLSGTQRLNVDMGMDGTFDCYYDITPQTFGFPWGTWADFPDLAVSNNFLFHSSNVFYSAGGFAGAFAARYSLAEAGNCQTLNFSAYTDSGFGSFKFTRGAQATMYFADHISTASIRIWSWPEGSGSPTSVDRTVTAWYNNTRVCPGPDARDWCGFIDSRLAAAYVADGIVGLMWVPSQGGGFPYPYTRIAQFSTGALTLIGEPAIWNDSLAWVYPSVAVNRNGDLGGTIMAGGGSSLYASCIAWIADDVNGDTLAPLDNQVALFGTSGPSQNRSGDYNSTQPYYPNDLLWAGGCFAYLSTTAGSSRYILFGREESASIIFEDGFESGNMSAWSATVP